MKKSKKIILAAVISLAVILGLFTAFFFYAPVIKEPISENEPIITSKNDGVIEYNNQKYIRLDSAVYSAYGNFGSEKNQAFLILKNDGMKQKTIYFGRRKTLADAVLGKYDYSIYDDKIISENDELVGYTYLKDGIVIPKLKKENIASVDVIDNSKLNLNSSDLFAMTGYYGTYQSKIQDSVLGKTDVSSFADCVNNDGNLLSLYTECAKKYNTPNIIFKLNFKDGNVPFSAVFASEAIIGSARDKGEKIYNLEEYLKNQKIYFDGRTGDKTVSQNEEFKIEYYLMPDGENEKQVYLDILYKNIDGSAYKIEKLCRESEFQKAEFSENGNDFTVYYSNGKKDIFKYNSINDDWVKS